MGDPEVYATFAVISAAAVVSYGRRLRASARRAEQVRNAMRYAGGEPVSLHPALDPNRCISIGACARACPEGDIIGMVNGRPELLAPNKCIGHGACAAACPVDAITLVFGTETRGVDIPHVRENFETNVDNIFIAGELGGMGLIRNAVTQGRQAMEHIAERRAADSSVLDVVVVGAGPAGLAGTLQAEKMKLRYVTVDQYDTGGTILSYPRQKLVMTQPMDIPLYGRFSRREVTKEELLDLWNGIIRRTGVEIRTKERLESVSRAGDVFDVVTTKGTYRARNILLAIGRRGTPRKLGVPGENLAKVTYRLIEPEQYRESRVLVVGGGDSAVEAAVSLAGTEGTTVTLSYRRDTFSRVKPDNVARLEEQIAAGRIDAVLRSNVVEITEGDVTLDVDGAIRTIPNDYVLIFAGGELPTPFLTSLGIRVETKFGQR